MPIFSFPSSDAIGTLTDAQRYLGYIKEAGLSRIHILPTNPTIEHDSPFQGPSLLYGNPNLINIEKLFTIGDLSQKDFFSYLSKSYEISYKEKSINYGFLWNEKIGFGEDTSGFENGPLRKAYQGLIKNGGKRLDEFNEFKAKEGRDLEDYSDFMTLKQKLGFSLQWSSWPEKFRLRKNGYSEELPKEEKEFYKYVQFVFNDQLKSLSNSAKENELTLSGIMPLYPCFDCADVWANKDLFLLDASGFPVKVACVPPDFFEPVKGQLWGNPLWKYGKLSSNNKEKVYEAFANRLERLLENLDIIEIDHYRGLTAFGAVDFGASDARDGKWIQGPGNELFHYLEERLGKSRLPFEAEDLGLITPKVHRDRIKMGYPGMKVFQIANINDKTDIHHPEHNEPNSVYYLGTHNNTTLKDFLFGKKDNLESGSQQDYINYLEANSSEEGYNWKAIDVALSTKSNTTLLTISDIRNYGNEKRFNRPGSVGWWKVNLSENEMEKFKYEDAPILKELIEQHKRI